jgi:carboxymethylenebutenolidase
MGKKDPLPKHDGGKVSRREFLHKSAWMAGSAVAANALGNILLSAPAYAVQVDANDPALISADVKYPSADGIGLSAYLTRPKGDGARPAVMVIHPWSGVDEHTRDVGRRLAKAGYVALVPDLLARVGGTSSFASREAAIAAGRKLSDDMITNDLNGAVNYLKRQSFVHANRIGVIGFCWGGGKALLFTTRSKDLAAAVIYYGSNPRDLEAVQNITAPVLGQYGGADERITLAVPKLEEAMKKYGKSFDYKIYPGAPHAFNSDDSPSSYREEAAKEAWGRTLEFFKKHLQS